MATKDWKKFSEKEDTIGWQKETQDGWKHIIVNYFDDGIWVVSTTLYASDDKNFKTKQQALSYAKKYMRTH